jgi:hypothetical protein
MVPWAGDGSEPILQALLCLESLALIGYGQIDRLQRREGCPNDRKCFSEDSDRFVGKAATGKGRVPNLYGGGVA